mmetsp:Transcript_23495/g.65074  ORF Transcript_23495/g.65074 Transcript_23495/m.65074 type:complete len:122 (-) Transcript_23495:607-972(-)
MLRLGLEALVTACVLHVSRARVTKGIIIARYLGDATIVAWGLLQQRRLIACIPLLLKMHARVSKGINFARFFMDAATVAWGLLQRRRLIACVLLLLRMHSSCRRSGSAMWKSPKALLDVVL